MFFYGMKFRIQSAAAIIIQKYVRRWLVLTADERAMKKIVQKKRRKSGPTSKERRDAVKAAMGMTLTAKRTAKKKYKPKVDH